VLVELGLVEQRYKAVSEVFDGATVVDVARRNGVSRQTVHDWLRHYASHGMAGLADKSSEPMSCPQQMPPWRSVSAIAAPVVSCALMKLLAEELAERLRQKTRAAAFST
jgi:transposase-like protein